jgi:hypothetical protein
VPGRTYAQCIAELQATGSVTFWPVRLDDERVPYALREELAAACMVPMPGPHQTPKRSAR